MLGRSIGNNDRSFSSPRSREGNELRSLAVEFSVDVVGIIISQLINVHIIISEDAGNGDGARRKGEGEGKREREREEGRMEVQLHRHRGRLRLVQLRLRLGIIEEINCA